MQIFFSPYKLKRLKSSNLVTHSTYQEGALIKVVDENGRWGVADLCPWPSLGDLSLESELASRGPLFCHAIALATEDLNARIAQRKRISAEKISNHFLISDFEGLNCSQIKNANVYKFKVGLNYQKFAVWINRNFEIFEKIRIDFNSILNEKQFREFVNDLIPEVLKKIETIEDPFKFNLESWTEFNQKVSIACDFEPLLNWSTKIGKPARNFENDVLYYTSSMDHPIGIAHAMYFAQQQPSKTHGLLTLDFYEETQYNKYFKVEGSILSLLATGFGIGFDEEIKNENWVPLLNWESQSVDLLFDSKLNEESIKSIFKMKKEAVAGSILIPSSGSSGRLGDFKIYSFTKNALLNSARRTNQFYKIEQQTNWGCVIPLFHVGGFGILARAYLTNSKVFFLEWKKFSIDWILINNINFISLVPTQVFDLVNQDFQCPSCVKLVFVGGGHLNENISKQAKIRGWPIVETYGMTETGSMIAIKNAVGDFELLPGVSLVSDGDQIHVVCDSIFSQIIELKNGQLESESRNSIGCLLPDEIEMTGLRTFKIRGRKDEQVKIRGELVNLAKIRNILFQMGGDPLQVVAMNDLRNEYTLCLVGEKKEIQDLKSIAKKINEKLNSFERVQFCVVVDQLPRTSLGKILVKQLSESIERDKKYEKI